MLPSTECRTVKLRVVEGVKSLQAQFEGFRFGELEVLLQRQIVIVDPRPGEESAAAVPDRAERRQTEERRIEVRVSIARVVIQIERTVRIFKFIDGQIVDAVSLRSQQGSVLVIVERHREAGAVSG